MIIADEPTTALDVTIQAQILLLLAQLQKEFQMAMILITHDLGVVSTVADDLAVMYAGRSWRRVRTEQIFLDPLHPYTQGLFNCLPIPGRTPRGSHLGSIPGKVPLFDRQSRTGAASPTAAPTFMKSAPGTRLL